MRRIICSCMFLGLIFVYTNAYSQREEKITVTSYYPSPSGVYQTIRINPSDTPPADPKPGQIFYNNTTDMLQYLNKTNDWSNISISGVSDNMTQIIRRNTPPASPVAGDIFFNNSSNSIMYFTNAGKWVNISGPGYWSEGAMYSSPPFWYYPVSLENRAIQRRVGIGTRTPEAALTVHKSENSWAEEPVIAKFTKILNAGSTGSPKNQTLDIALYPTGTANSYLRDTAVISTPENPGGNLQLLTDDEAHSISFNVGGYNTSATEVMRFRNPGYAETEGTQNTIVGIGNATAPYALFVDSNQSNTTPFGLRGRRTGVKSAIAAITPYNNSVWITYGCYLENNTWKHSEYEYPVGTKGRDGCAFVLSPQWGGKWWMYGVNNLTADNKTVTGWRVQNKTLWNITGHLAGASSRKFKENFVHINQNDFLRQIDRLDISRWNFKADERSNTHIGPVAEDFNEVFDLGRKNRKSIYLIDEIGVSLAGIKALSEKIKAQNLIIKELKSELKYLESQMSRKGGL